MNIFSFLTPSAPVIGCRLPPPTIRQAAPKRAKQTDIFAIDEQRAEFGFRVATAINQQEGAVSDLTGWDIEELKARGLWGSEKTLRGRTNKRGAKTNHDNLKAKAAWRGGGNAASIAKGVGLGDSWAEKRHAAFEAALSNERGEGK